MQLDLPPLAQYRNRSEYNPAYGDYIIWSGWLTTWHGIIINYMKETNQLHVVFAGVPFLLFTMTEEEQEKETRKLKLSQIKNAPNGKFAILQQDAAKKTNIWYI